MDFLCNKERVIGAALCRGDQKMWQKRSLVVLGAAPPREPFLGQQVMQLHVGVPMQPGGAAGIAAGISFLELTGWAGRRQRALAVRLGSQGTQSTASAALGPSTPSVQGELTPRSALQT